MAKGDSWSACHLALLRVAAMMIHGEEEQEEEKNEEEQKWSTFSSMSRL